MPNEAKIKTYTRDDDEGTVDVVVIRDNGDGTTEIHLPEKDTGHVVAVSVPTDRLS